MTPQPPGSAALRQRIPRVHIVGRKNSGKTTLVCELLQQFHALDLRVASVKHTHHQHELDTPGKDSFRHRQAGAAAVGILSPGMQAAFVPHQRSGPENRLGDDDPYQFFQSTFADCDLMLVEGDLHTDAPRVEVWRSVTAERPYAADNSGIAAVVTEDECPGLAVPVLPRSQVAEIADWLISLVRLVRADAG